MVLQEQAVAIDGNNELLRGHKPDSAVEHIDRSMDGDNDPELRLLG
mgnify:CR=1 FL=1